jgi:hypothetical protein
MPRVEPAENNQPFYVRPFWQFQGSAVAGTWAWYGDGKQTDTASVQGQTSGAFINTTAADVDEYAWGSIYLTRGKYKVDVSYSTNFASGGIAEVLFGTRSLGTQDQYATSNNYNQTFTKTFTLVDNTTADMRFRANGKNTSSTGYVVDFSRFKLSKTG